MIKRLLLIVVSLTGLIAASAGGFYVYVESDGNFHAVDPGTLYRSRQLSGTELAQAIGAYGIRSILNLRGPNPGSEWYDDEMAVSADKHVFHYDYRISARRAVTPAQIREILGIIRNAPKPMLIHCMGGADRTGLVSAIYLFSHGARPDEAERELSLRYGHFPYLGSKTRAMDDSFHAYVMAAATQTN
jgi:protein tyrosine/serine phosphatase